MRRAAAVPFVLAPKLRGSKYEASLSMISTALPFCRAGLPGRRIRRPLVESFRSGGAREQPLFDEPADDMTGGDMDLLDERRRIRRGIQAQIAERGHFPAGSSGH